MDFGHGWHLELLRILKSTLIECGWEMSLLTIVVCFDIVSVEFDTTLSRLDRKCL